MVDGNNPGMRDFEALRKACDRRDPSPADVAELYSREVAGLAVLHWTAGNRNFACSIVRTADHYPGSLAMVAAIVTLELGTDFVDSLAESIRKGLTT